MNKNKITIGISSCLLGEKVRYDGKDKRDVSLIKRLHQICSLLPICPEVEIGMSVPRERLNVFGSVENPIMIAEESKKDWTEPMTKFCQKRVVQEDFQKISGLILKSKSPSCGIKSVKIFSGDTIISEQGNGFFATAVRECYPFLPIIDELSLKDSYAFDEFIKLVINYSQKKYYNN